MDRLKEKGKEQGKVIVNKALGEYSNRAWQIFHEVEDAAPRRSKYHPTDDDKDATPKPVNLDHKDAVRNLFRDQDYTKIVNKSSGRDLFEDKRFDTSSHRLLTKAAQGNSSIKWLRPHQIVKNPEFFVGGRDRFDIKQGEVGNCWFLSSLANLAENKRCFDRVVPSGQSFRDGYKGIFRFRFFR